MTITMERPNGCLPPVLLDEVVADGEHIRDLARANGPYFMPARYLIGGGAAADAADTTHERREVPSYLIGPVWRGDWAVRGEARIDGAEPLLHHQAFIEAAKSMCDADVVVPEQVYVNLTTPMGGIAFSHVDIPEFVGIDRTNAPGWFLQAMGNSRLFEDVRITIATAVAWFHHGERGYFRYWPNGRDAESVRQENMWNTAVVGDNDFMHHKVERVGPDDMGPSPDLTIDTALDHDGDQWQIVDGDRVLETHPDDRVRLSLSWKAKVYADDATRQAADAGKGGVAIDEALARFAHALDEPLAATGPGALASDALREQFTARWTGYVPG